MEELEPSKYYNGISTGEVSYVFDSRFVFEILDCG